MLRHARERMGDGILPPLAAFDNRHRLPPAAQIVGHARRKLSRQRDDEVGDPITRHECIDAALKDRPPAKRKELLRLRAAKARAAAPSRNDRGHMHCDRFYRRPKGLRLPERDPDGVAVAGGLQASGRASFKPSAILLLILAT